MSEAVEIVIIASALSLAGVLYSTWRNSKTKPEIYAGINSINAATIENLSKQINELTKRDEEKEKRIDTLEKELKKYVNAYARAVKYIYEKDPLAELPNFMVTTDPTITKKK
jgi:cell division protein FtsB